MSVAFYSIVLATPPPPPPPPPLNAPTFGYEECQCANSSSAFPSVDSNELAAWDATLDMSTYGVGCAAHDVGNSRCSATAPAWCAGIVPIPPDCRREVWHPEWCEKQWCWVDNSQPCRLANEHSLVFASSPRYYSYAACGDLDLYFRTDPAVRLTGRVLRVGVQSNSGGWQGSYHPSQKAHARTDEWTGPLWDFATQAMADAGVTVNITAPDELVRARVLETFNSTSSFWHCTYATALGLLDLCIGMHTVTPQRFELTEWYVVQYNALHLIVRERDGYQGIIQAILFVFEPFETEVWWLILGLSIPLVALVVTMQERMLGALPQEWNWKEQEMYEERRREAETKMGKRLNPLKAPAKRREPSLAGKVMSKLMNRTDEDKPKYPISRGGTFSRTSLPATVRFTILALATQRPSPHGLPRWV